MTVQDKLAKLQLEILERQIEEAKEFDAAAERRDREAQRAQDKHDEQERRDDERLSTNSLSSD